MSDLIGRAHAAQVKRTKREAKWLFRWERLRKLIPQNEGDAQQQWERRKTERQALKWVRKRLGIEATVVGWDKYFIQHVYVNRSLYGDWLELQLPNVPCKVVWQTDRRWRHQCLILMCPAHNHSHDISYETWEVYDLADLPAALGKFTSHCQLETGLNGADPVRHQILQAA